MWEQTAEYDYTSLKRHLFMNKFLYLYIFYLYLWNVTKIRRALCFAGNVLLSAMAKRLNGFPAFSVIL